jgi:hypothetical protein
MWFSPSKHISPLTASMSMQTGRPPSRCRPIVGLLEVFGHTPVVVLPAVLADRWLAGERAVSPVVLVLVLDHHDPFLRGKGGEAAGKRCQRL